MFTLSGFRNFQDSTIEIPFVMNTLREDYCFGTKKIAIWLLMSPKIINISKLQKITLCFVIDIGTILTQNHSCFLTDIGLISMIFEILLNGSSSCFGAHLFQTWQRFGSPHNSSCIFWSISTEHKKWKESKFGGHFGSSKNDPKIWEYVRESKLAIWE